MSTVPQQNVSAHISRYEELRRHVMEQQSQVGRLGLAILLRQGLAAWVDQWSRMPTPTPAPSPEMSWPPILPDDTSANVINVLTAMALGHVQEVHA